MAEPASIQDNASGDAAAEDEALKASRLAARRLWLTRLALVVIVVGWIAARPLVVAPIAKLFGKVSGR